MILLRSMSSLKYLNLKKKKTSNDRILNKFDDQKKIYIWKCIIKIINLKVDIKIYDGL